MNLPAFLAIGGHGVLLRGPSGAGKSDLALRLLTGTFCMPTGVPAPVVKLVCDDRAILAVRGAGLFASPAPVLAGLLEVRGVGVLKLPFVSDVPIALVCDLVAGANAKAGAEIERRPASGQRTEFGAISLPQMLLDPREPSAAAKVLIAIGLIDGALQSLQI